MTRRATRSRDGRFRFTLRVDHRIGREDLVDVLAYAKTRDETPESLTRESLVTLTRETYRHSAESAAWWRDDADEDADEIEQWAEDVVDDLFPELSR